MSSLRIEALRFLTLGPIDLTIAAGECIAVSGSSGAGKTLMLRAIADLDPHTGDVLLDGTQYLSIAAPEWRRRVGMLPAESRWWHDKVGPHFGDVQPEWLERLGFGVEVMDWSVSRLSSGERQRLGLLRLLANRPQALLLDEPTANVDAGNTARMEALIAEYRATAGAAVLWVTHQREQGRRIAQRRFHMSAGRLSLEEAQ